MEWSRLRGRFTRGKSQGFMVLLVGLLVGIFGGILTTSTPVFAVDATWNNSRLQYQNQSFTPIDDSTMLENLDLEESARAYGVATQENGVSEFRVIAFPSGANMQTAESAEYMVFDYTPPNTYTLATSSTITTEPAGENQGGLEQGTSCTVSGIGWFVCPISNFLASGMDWLYGVLSQFLVSQPLNVSDNTSGLYIAWDIMRGLANAVFIISFIIIIYSHITSVGISNYGIKKMLPRLVIAALLVNLSFYICAIAIDLSNVIGQSIQDMFISIRNTITTVGGGSQEMPTWEGVTTAILSAGTVAVGAATFFFAFGGDIGAAAILLLPLLLGLLITVIVVLLVLAARQALIVILTIISPLAFVAYLLPGTEKWFDKWKDLFITMLIFFPAFSAVFGGSQLAGAAIIQNADSIVMLILGLGVQVAPLAIAPLILKLSGGLLNRFAGIVNNPAKGVVDKTRNWAQDQSKYLANRARSKENTKWSPGKKLGQKAFFYQQRRKERIDNYQKKADAAYKATTGHEALDKQRREIEMGDQLTQKMLDVNWNDHLSSDARAKEIDLKVRIKADEVELSKLKLDGRYETFKTGLGDSHGMETHQEAAVDLTRNIAIEGLANQSAKRVQSSLLAKQLEESTELQNRAGELENLYLGQNRGSQRALASALQTVSGIDEESIKNAATILSHSNYTDNEIAQMAIGSSFTGGPTVTNDLQAASIRHIFGGKNDVDMTWALKNMDLSAMSSELRQEVGDALLKNGDKPVWVGAKVAADIKASVPEVINMRGQDLFNEVITITLNQNKLGSADKLLSQTPGQLKEVVTALPNISGDVSQDIKNEIIKQIVMARQNPLYSGRIAERKEQIEALYNTLSSQVGGAPYATYDDIPD